MPNVVAPIRIANHSSGRGFFFDDGLPTFEERDYIVFLAGLGFELHVEPDGGGGSHDVLLISLSIAQRSRDRGGVRYTHNASDDAIRVEERT